MKHEKLETLMNGWKDEDAATTKEWGIALGAVARAYRHSNEQGLDLLNFEDFVENEDIPQTARLLRILDIREFTTTSGWSGQIARLQIWDGEGFKVAGFKTLPLKRGWREEDNPTPAMILKAE